MASPRVYVLMGLGVVAFGCHEEHGRERDRKNRFKTEDPSTPVAATTSSKVNIRDATAVEVGAQTYAWTGVIRESTGTAPAVGKTCVLTTHVWSTSNTTINHDMLTVACEGRTLYDDHASFGGQQQWELRLRETPAFEPSTFAYSLTANDIGTRTGDRNQLTASTRDGEIVVFRDIAPTFRVKIATSGDGPVRRGKPIFENDIPPFTESVSRKAKLTSSTGTLPFGAKECELLIVPGSKGHNCRARVKCASQVIFGLRTTGFEDCTLDAAGRPVAFTDKDPTSVDKDPALTVDLTANTASLSDDTPTNYSATFALE
jgi:hypothetical protein